jgi:DNA uptake protein ComE-like DNA-binding protein
LLLGLLWSVIAVAGWAVAIATHGSALSGLLIILGWGGAIATSFGIRSSYRRLSGSSFEEAVAGAKQRLHERDRARKLASERPALAKELGIGRPDLPQAHDAGLIDVNNAPASVLSKLPGFDGAFTTKVVEARAQMRGFASVEDLGMALDLDGDTVERLRSLVVFLPLS